MKTRIKNLIDALSNGLYERQEIIAVALLSALSGQSIFLYGLPGTAKSLIARRLSKAFKDSTHFEYLMQRFSTPEDVFGPVSIQELKQDKYIRKTKGYLPTADLAFLDEIWKSSPAILNTLLTIINERIFRNGETEEPVPLKALIAASNETPPPSQGLEALYDRFVMRVILNPMKERANFESLLDGDSVLADIHISDKLQFSHAEWQTLLTEIPTVKISKEVMDIIHSIRISLEEYNKNNEKTAVYVSDRRWQKIALVLKTSAYLCGRQVVIPVDALIIRHCLWTLAENWEPIEEIIESCVRDFGVANKQALDKWLSDYNDLDIGVKDTFFYTENIYDTEDIGGKQCFQIIVNIQKHQYQEFVNIKRYASIEHIGNKDEFFVVDEDGKVDDRIVCTFDGGKTCTVKINTDIKQYGWDSGYKSNSYKEINKITPPIKYKKGTQKPVHQIVKTTFKSGCTKLLQSLETIISNTKVYIAEQNKQNDTPFIPEDKRKIVLTALESYLQELEQHKLNAEHLLEKVNSYAVSK
jgi:MoxR-like ATPase